MSKGCLMSKNKQFGWYGIANLIVVSLLLSSCGSSTNGSASLTAASTRTGSATPEFAYIASRNTLTRYSISTSGSLTAVAGSPLTFPGAKPEFSQGIVQVVTDPTGHFLYVLDQTSGIYAYVIDWNTGQLTEIAGSPFETPGGPTSLAFATSGSQTFLYVAGETSVTAPVNTFISAYFIDPSGALVPLTNYTVSGELSTIVTAGNRLYVAGFYTNSVAAFSIGPSGELSEDVPGSPFATDTGPYSIAVDPSGSVLYTANAGTPTATTGAPGSISGFTIDSSTGALTPVQGNPQPIPVQGLLSIDPMGRFLFVPETSGVSVYTINTSTGVPAAVAGSPFSAGTSPFRSLVSVGPTNETLYVVDGGSAEVSEFALASTGALTPLPGSPVAVGTNSCCIAVISTLSAANP